MPPEVEQEVATEGLRRLLENAIALQAATYMLLVDLSSHEKNPDRVNQLKIYQDKVFTSVQALQAERLVIGLPDTETTTNIYRAIQ